MNILYSIFIILCIFHSYINIKYLKEKEININNIFSYKYIFIHHPWNKNSQIIYKSLKEISPNDLIIINIIQLSDSELFLKDLSNHLANIISNKIDLKIQIPLLFKLSNNHLEIYNNNPGVKVIRQFFEENKKENLKIFSKINYDFLYEIIFNQKNCLIIFYIKNKKSKKIIKQLIQELKQKIKIFIAFTDITNKYSYKLFNILEGYENSLPCLRYLTFKNNKLFFTKKDNFDIFDKNINNILFNFVNNSINHKLFYHIYHDGEFPKINNDLIINKYCEKKKYIIDLYYNDWCEFCIELFIIIDDILKEYKYLFRYFKYKKHLLKNNYINNDFYFSFLPRLHINDIFKNITYEYCGDFKKENIFNFLIHKINLFNFFEF